ncbi:MAG: aryl-sulfate sulfotransferase [Alphaproteobacteria bacterium]
MKRVFLILLLSVGCLLTMLWLLGCEHYSESDNHDDNTSPVDDDATDDDTNEENDDTVDDDTFIENEYTVTVWPASDFNPLARKVTVETTLPCSLSGYVIHPDEPGYGPSYPAATPVGTSHELWFVGLLEQTTFTYRLYEVDAPATIVAQGEFTTPKLSPWAARMFRMETTPQADPSDWIAADVNTGLYEETEIILYNTLVIFDRQGRLRFYHEIWPTPEFPYVPISGLRTFNNGHMAFTNQQNLVAIEPSGEEYLFFPINISEPYRSKSHHLFHVDDYDAEMAYIMFNRFGPGVKCDLVTPTYRAIGDGVSIINKDGDELWRWTAFEHQDAIPPEAMNQFNCENHHFGEDTYDWTHGNSVIPVPGENAILISLRNVERLIKVAVPSGEVLWQMGPGLDFTWLGDEPEEDKWFLQQHDPQWLAEDRLLLFDNGNCRYDEDCNHGPWSRALELLVDEDAMTVEVLWEQKVPFSHARGNQVRHENGNTLIFNGWSGYLVEVTPDHQEIWKAEFPGIYRPAGVIYYPAMWTYE